MAQQMHTLTLMNILNARWFICIILTEAINPAVTSGFAFAASSATSSHEQLSSPLLKAITKVAVVLRAEIAARDTVLLSYDDAMMGLICSCVQPELSLMRTYIWSL